MKLLDLLYCYLLCTHLVVLHDVQDQLPQCISRITAFFMQYRPVRRILKRGVQGTAWPLGHDEGEGAGGGCAPSRAKLLHYG